LPSALDIAARIMGDDLYRLNLVSQNLANASTAGYKRSVAVATPFAEHLEAGTKSFAVSLSALSAAIDPRQGPLTQTGGALDLALEGPGFFELAGAEGPLYSRQGSFHVDAGGRLVNGAGLAVMGVSGEILLSGTEPRIDRQGRAFEGERQVAQLKIVRFADPAALAPLGGGLYRAGAAGETSLDSLQVRQGFLEASNVVSLNEMIAMIGLTRRFEAAQRVVQNYDGMLGTAIRTLGEF
jgi:flagellar basal-body rod protein FlgF